MTSCAPASGNLEPCYRRWGISRCYCPRSGLDCLLLQRAWGTGNYWKHAWWEPKQEKVTLPGVLFTGVCALTIFPSCLRRSADHVRTASEMRLSTNKFASLKPLFASGHSFDVGLDADMKMLQQIGNTLVHGVINSFLIYYSSMFLRVGWWFGLGLVACNDASFIVITIISTCNV